MNDPETLGRRLCAATGGFYDKEHWTAVGQAVIDDLAVREAADAALELRVLPTLRTWCEDPWDQHRVNVLRAEARALFDLRDRL